MTEHRALPPQLGLADLRWLHRLASSLVRDEHLAEDASQETLLRALQQAPRHLQGRRLRTWLVTVLRNVVRTGMRKESLRREHEQQRARETPEIMEDQVALLRSRHALATHVLSLPEPLRTAVLWRYQEGLSHAEVAARLGVTETTARQRVSRAIRKLRERLDADGVGRTSWTAVHGLDDLEPGPLALAGTLGGTWMKAKILAIGAAACFGVVTLGVLTLRPREASLPEPHPPRTTATLAEADRPPANGSDRSALAADTTAGRVPSPAPAVSDLFSAVDRELDLHGFVLGPDDSPVADARVEARLDPERTYGSLSWGHEDPGRTIGETRTDGRGAFVMRLEPGEPVDLLVAAEGFATSRREGRLPGEYVVIRLAAAARVAGRLVDVSGAGVPGGAVVLTSDVAGYVPVATAETGPDGAFSLDRVEAGRVLLECRAPGYADPSPRALELVPGQTTEVRVELSRGRVARGRVFEAHTGHPIPDARVRQIWSSATTTTGPDGRYRLTGISPHGSLDLQVEADGWARTEARMSPGVDGVSEVDFALEPGRRIRGRVVDHEGAAVAGAGVTAAGASFDGDTRGTDWVVARTEGDGSFQLDGLRTDLDHVLRVVSRGHGTQLWDLPGALEDLGTLVLPPSTLLAGTVTGEDGRPVTDIEIWIRTSPETRGALGAPVRETAGRLASERSGRCDDLGRFAFANMAPGTVEVRVSGHREGPGPCGRW